MIAVGIVFAVYLCTYIGCNEKIDGNIKAGFFVVFGIICAVVFLFGWLLG